MAAYVDRPQWYWRAQYWCHLLADSLDELHDFAGRLGKPRQAFQARRLPHYDLTIVQRRIALDLGAIEVRSRDIVLLARRLRVEQVACRPDDGLGARAIGERTRAPFDNVASCATSTGMPDAIAFPQRRRSGDVVASSRPEHPARGEE